MDKQNLKENFLSKHSSNSNIASENIQRKSFYEKQPFEKTDFRKDYQLMKNNSELIKGK